MYFVDNMLTMTFEQTTQSSLIHNVSFETLPISTITQSSTTASSPTGLIRTYKNRDFLKTDAPMLNYIFDTHSSKGKHHHHDTYKWGPHFDPSEAHLNGTTVTVQVGDTAILNCKVNFLQDKTVSI